MNKWRTASLALVASILIYGCNGSDEDTSNNSDNLNVVPAPITLSYQIINQFKHDTSAFTEGFTFYDGKLFEGLCVVNETFIMPVR